MSGARLRAKLLLILTLFVGWVSQANAGLFCSDFPFNGVVDGNERAIFGGSYSATPADPFPTQITIDTDCTFKNFDATNPLTATLNFQTNDPSVYLITFDNVVFTGNMACSNVDHRIWFVNGADYGSKNSCQDLFIPVEAIQKSNPPGTTFVGIGEQFEYTLTIPVLFDPVTQTYVNNLGSPNDLHTITVVDDLNATGANLTVTGTPSVTWDDGVTPVAHTYTNVGGVLTFVIDPTVIIPADSQIIIKIPVSVDNTNVVGTSFFNTATWTFGRLIDIDGVPTFFDPLPGENGVTTPLTIGAPDLALTKSSLETTVNVTSTVNFTIDVQNTGSTEAWGARIIDYLPDEGAGSTGMCDFNPTATVVAGIYESDGTTPVAGSAPLTQGTDYTVTYTGAPTCSLQFEMTSANAVIGPSQRLIITYDSQLDPPPDTGPTDDGKTFTNYAGVNRWYSGDPTDAYPDITYTRSDPPAGTINTVDATPGTHEDSHTLTAVLSGYIFQKTVQNLTTLQNPATLASPGDTLRYQLRLYNFDETIQDLVITDVLSAADFDRNSVTNITLSPAGLAEFTYDNTTGTLTVDGIGAGSLILDPVTSPDLTITFDVDVSALKVNGDTVTNQADLTATGTVTSTQSDDPSDGIYDPDVLGSVPTPTVVSIQSADSLIKENPVGGTTYTIGDEFTYTIRVPEVTVPVPIYDVKIYDDLTAHGASLSLVSATVAGGSWTLTNTGTPTSIVLEDTGTGIDIPANGQAVVTVTVRVDNVAANQEGNTFTNEAYYTYNRSNGNDATVTTTSPYTIATPLTIVEPNISTVVKAVSNATPVSGETVRYSVEFMANNGANNSDVFDVTVIDVLDSGLTYAGNPTLAVVSGGGGVAADNVVGEPDIAIDAVTQAETLTWGLGSDDPSDIDLPPGTVLRLEYDVRVDNAVLANSGPLNNTATVQWTSREGFEAFERDGSGGVNDYFISDSASVSTPAAVATLTKGRSSDTYDPVVSDDFVRVGDIVYYSLTVNMQEGSYGNLQIVDTLPQGLQYEGVVSINTDTIADYTSAGTFQYADITAANITSSVDGGTGITTVTWDLGTVTNVPDGDGGAPEDFVIVYKARVLNDVLDVNNTSINLQNSAAMTYDTNTTPGGNTSNYTVTVYQPQLTITKSAVEASADGVVSAGETVTYTIEVSNAAGTSPAYDFVIQDVLPVGLDNTTLNTTSITLLSGAAPSPYTDLEPVFNAAGRTLTWNFDRGLGAQDYIPAGDTLIITYTVNADASLGSGVELTNSATATDYYSFDDENIPADSILAGRQHYGPSNTDSTTLYSGTAAPGKVLNPVITEATIGEEVVYHITVPGTAATDATIYDVVITDSLDAGLTYISASDVSANSFTVTDNTVGNNVSLSIDQIPAGQQAVIELRVRVANNIDANAGDSVTNIATYEYAFVDGSATRYSSSSTITGVDDTFTIVEPLLTISKSVENLTNPGNPPGAGDVLRYTVSLPDPLTPPASLYNTDAYDITLVDTLSAGLSYQSGTATVDGAGNTITDPVISGQTLTWSLANGTADIDVPEGTTVTITYDVVVLDTVQAGQDLENLAQAQWTSLDGIDPNERNGSQAPAENDYITGQVTATVTVPDNTTFNKSLVSDTYDDAPSTATDGNIRVGDIVLYELRMGLEEGTTPSVVVTDNLPQGLVFEGVVNINGDTTAPYSQVSPFTHSDVVIATSGSAATGTTLTFTIGDIVNAGDNNTTNNDFVIVYRARVTDDSAILAQAASTALINTSSMDYTLLSGPVSRPAFYRANLQQPVIAAVTKTALPAGGDTVLDANEVVTYTVEFQNTGDAPAYDIVLEDILPVGFDETTLNTTGIQLVTLAGTSSLTPFNPNFDGVTRTLSWDFDRGGANTYTLPAGATLRVIYAVTTANTLAPGMTLTNTALVNRYFSFDDEDVPAQGGVNGVRRQYGPSASDSVILTTAAVTALNKEITQSTAQIGIPFSYTITIPATAQTTALNDVRILDDLTNNAVAPDPAVTMSFVSATYGPSNTPLTNLGTATNLILVDPVTGGLDIPAGSTVAVTVTVVLEDTANNIAGRQFTNTADYTYNLVNDDATTQTLVNQPVTSAAMTIVEPSLTLTKNGPATIRVADPASFTLDIHNAGLAPAYGVVIEDRIPNPVPGGMCDDRAPDSFVVEIQTAAYGFVSTVDPADYTTNLVTGTPTCTLTITLAPSVELPADNRLIVTYNAYLDADTTNGFNLVNHAGVTEWLSGDTSAAGATPYIRTYNETLTDPVTAAAILDFEDAHTVTTELPIINVTKTVINQTSGAATAAPGDVLRYTITVDNTSAFGTANLSIIDDLDQLNATAMFVPGSMANITINAPGSTPDSTNTDPLGGSKGTGLIDIRNLQLGADGSGTDVITVTFDVTLISSIPNGTIVLNQGGLVVPYFGTLPTHYPPAGVEDPLIIGDETPTPITIVSTPIFQVQKISDDITGSATVLIPGDTLRYTITVKNTGTEDAVNTILRDLVPANTTYVANSTTLNGSPVADPAAGVSPLESGIQINAPENTTAGYMRADATATTSNVATIVFDVTVNANVVDGTIIANQGFVNADRTSGGAITETPSDDPGTITVNDPTRDIVGSLPLVDAQKTVQLYTDVDGDGQVDENDVLRYTVTITNYGFVPAVGVQYQDDDFATDIPDLVTYVPNSTTLNGFAVVDPAAGVAPSESGMDVSSSDLTLPLPTPGNGTLSPGASAIVVYDVQVNAGVTTGVIVNQGFVSNNQTPTEPTDADGDDSNGDQPTQIAVGAAQQLSISKSVSVIGGGAALPGGQLEYVVTVTNIGATAATNVVITDDLDNPVAGQMTYIPGTASLNGNTAIPVFAGSTITADYSSTYGNLLPGDVVTLRFRVDLAGTLTIGTVVRNVADVYWDAGPLTAQAFVDITIGAVYGAGVLSGKVWHDADFGNDYDLAERALEGWTVQLYRNGSQIGSVATDTNGDFQFSGVAANDINGDVYMLRYVAPGATATTAMLGLADSPFTNGLQTITDILVTPSSLVQNLNLPIDPNGVVYNSFLRTPVPGATLTMLNATSGNALPASCFDDPAQQGQVTLADGYYKFDINFTDLTNCPPGAEYIIQVTAPVDDYINGESVIIPATTSAAGPAYDVPGCPGDAVGVTTACEVQTFETAPPQAILAGSPGTNYHLRLTLTNPQPDDSQLFNNHLPIDPDLAFAVSISKTSPLVNVSRGEIVPYTITISNTLPLPVADVTIIDTIPAGFKYVAGSARFDGAAVEPVINGLQLSWPVALINPNEQHVIKLLLVVGSGVKDGEYINQAQVFSTLINSNISGIATATVRVIPDPTFDCSDVIGKVYDDKNLNGHQDENETGIQGVRLATARGLLVTTDKYGRFHITCAATPDEQRGSNFIVKLDERTLPSGYRVTTENPRVQRITRGKMIKFNFGATVHRVVRLDVADGVFENDSDKIRPQWLTRVGLLIEELRKAPSVLRLTYLGDTEEAGLVEDRLDTLDELIKEHWDKIDTYKLVIEHEVFWRNGSPEGGGGLD